LRQELLPPALEPAAEKSPSLLRTELCRDMSGSQRAISGGDSLCRRNSAPRRLLCLACPRGRNGHPAKGLFTYWATTENMGRAILVAACPVWSRARASLTGKLIDSINFT